MSTYFQYGDDAVDYLRSKDRKLARAIDEFGHINREMDGTVFESVVKSIIGQQISTAAAKTVIARIEDTLGPISAESLSGSSIEELQAFGTTFRKAEYIRGFVDNVIKGEFDLHALDAMDDAEAIAHLSSIKGIGRWTSEMILLFSMNRMDIFAFDDLGIHRGLRAIYHHKEIDRDRFERYRRRFSPYGSVASLYIWEAAHRV